MKKTIITIALALIVYTTGTSQVNFESISFDEALAKAKAEHKKVFIDVYTTWCAPCKMMDENVFSNAEVGERMAEEYVALKIDYENSPYRRSVTRYHIKGYPTMLILDTTGIEMGRIYGSRPVEGFLNELDKYSGTINSRVNQAFINMETYPNDQKKWKESLGRLGSEINTLYRFDLFDAFDKRCGDYYENFEITSLQDETDYMIFRQVTLPLEHPAVQFYLTDTTEYGSYLHQDYMVLAFKKEVKEAGGDREKRREIKARVEEYYDLIYEQYYGDVDSLDYFLKSIFGLRVPD